MMDIKTKTAELVKRNINIDEDTTRALFDIGLLEEHICRKVLIREEYHSKSAMKRKTELKIYLAEKYCVSMSTVEKYIAGT
jgi:hypothetical protein